jgi:hypothetical protein
MSNSQWVSGLLLASCLTQAAVADAPSVGKPSAGISAAQLAQIRAGSSTKSQIKSVLGAPWRIVQFNDCGMAMPGQADEGWDYRGSDANGTWRLHVEFDDSGRATLVAKIPDKSADGAGTPAQTAPAALAHNMKM